MIIKTTKAGITASEQGHELVYSSNGNLAIHPAENRMFIPDHIMSCLVNAISARAERINRS